MFSPSGSQQASIEKEKRTFNLSNSESMSLHAFKGICVVDVCLGRFEEPLINDCGFTWVGTAPLFSTIPISSQEGLGLVHASKMFPCSPQFMQEPVFSLC